jgi:hypothetical protein
MAGSVTGNISVVSNATNSPAGEPLSGTGIHAVNLSWSPSSSQAAGYNIYRGSVSGGPYGKLGSCSATENAYTDTTVQAGRTYYYVTTAINSSGNENIFQPSPSRRAFTLASTSRPRLLGGEDFPACGRVRGFAEVY